VKQKGLVKLSILMGWSAGVRVIKKAVMKIQQEREFEEGRRTLGKQRKIGNPREQSLE